MSHKHTSKKRITLGSCAFRQWRATHSHCCKLHGYNLVAEFTIGCSNLDDKTWSYDFGGFKEIRKILQKQFDHTTCVASDDPEMDIFEELSSRGIIDLRVMDNVGIEKTAEWIYKLVDPIIDKETSGRCWVDKVEVFEHDDNSATYEKNTSKLIDWDKYTDQRSEGVQDNISAEKAPNVSPESSVTNRNPAAAGAAAPVGNNVTQGKSDWFKGTTWG